MKIQQTINGIVFVKNTPVSRAGDLLDFPNEPAQFAAGVTSYTIDGQTVSREEFECRAMEHEG